MRRRKNLIFWRIDKRMKQKDIADILGVTYSHYSNIERGISDPSYDLMLKFKNIFRVTDVLELFEQEDEINGNISTS